MGVKRPWEKHERATRKQQGRGCFVSTALARARFDRPSRLPPQHAYSINADDVMMGAPRRPSRSRLTRAAILCSRSRRRLAVISARSRRISSGVLPLFHIYGLTVLMCVALARQATL
eukprot:6193587-Pleurochrysis_carterae.AAC.1